MDPECSWLTRAHHWSSPEQDELKQRAEDHSLILSSHLFSLNCLISKTSFQQIRFTFI
jgi:hypothetical protein